MANRYTPSTFDFARQWDQQRQRMEAAGATPAQIQQAYQQAQAAANEAYPAWRAANVGQHFYQSPYFWAALTGTAGLVPNPLGGGVGGAAASSTAPITAGGAVAPAATAAPAVASGVLPATATVPAATGTVAGLSPWTSAAGQTWAGPAGGGLLGGLGRVLNSPAGVAGISAGAGLLGAGIASSGQTRAAEIQTQYLREALEYEKQRDKYLQNLEASRYGELTSRLQPYIGAGQSASERMAQLMGLPSGAGIGGSAATGTPQAPTQMSGSWTQPPTWPGAKGSPSGGFVTVQAPTGETRQMPAQQAQAFVARGARIVG